jgi:hypothetical protein
MFNKFWGKGDKPVIPPSKDGVDLRGLEVTEDDPDTVWSMWDDALAEQDSKFNALEPVGHSGTSAPEEAEPPTKPIALGAGNTDTQPMALEANPLNQRKDQALQTIELYHHRVANTIRSLWGHKECGLYINNLIMNGSDGMGHARIGFNQEAAEAMMVLSDLYEEEFGPVGAVKGNGSTQQSGFSGLDKFR